MCFVYFLHIHIKIKREKKYFINCLLHITMLILYNNNVPEHIYIHLFLYSSKIDNIKQILFNIYTYFKSNHYL